MDPVYLLKKKVRVEIEMLKLIMPGEKVVVGVSGGPDSLCLLHILKKIGEEIGFTIYATSLNHRFRGMESENEAEFVRIVSEEWGIPCSIESIDVPAFCKEKRLSKQVGARIIRYRFFYDIAKSIGAAKIAIAQTADDQAETFLMRLLRGAGVLGLSGIPVLREDIIIRPLLRIRRAEILEYLKRENISFITDSSNIKPIYMRNKIRLELIPTLAKEYNPNITDVLNREAEILSIENDFLDTYTLEIIDRLRVKREEKGISLDLNLLSSLHDAIKRRVLRWAIKEIKGDMNGISFNHIMNGINIIEGGNTGNRIDLPDSIAIQREYDILRVSICEKEMEVGDDMPPFAINVPGETYIPFFNMLIKVCYAERIVYSKNRKNIACFDSDKLTMPLMIRGKTDGDIFYPDGMGGHRKKLQDFFVDEKIPRRERKRIPLLVSPYGIIWVIGKRLDIRYIARKDKKDLLVVESFEKRKENKCYG
ncbi:MAG: tRNA lysidine(34) synthetase TilS [Nitrospirota bacterium]